MAESRRRLQQLLDSILDRTCTDAEMEEFSALAHTDPQRIAELIDQLQMSSLLRWHCGEARRLAAPVPARIESAERTSAALARLDRFHARRWQWAAALLIAAIGIGGWLLSRDWSTATMPLAEVVEEDHVKWADSTSALRDGGQIVSGRLELTSGKLTLRFRSGATLWVSGPAALRIDSAKRVQLDTGQATAKVPAWAKGFTIKTRAVEVVDLGTRFGVVARESGTTDIVVFEGRVDFRPSAAPQSPEKQLKQGEGVRVRSTGAIDRIVEVRRDSAGGRWTTDSPTWSNTTFKAIRDNIPSVDCPTYYQIIPHGLEDDCRAYTDCTHEWNGLTSAGLPDYLLHADYVMMRNDYRYLEKFGMIVELARPAIVYVFWDNRVPPEPWLTNQFEKTGVEIGLDEGPWRPDDNVHTVSVGGGQSIDTVFSVWLRRCEKPDALRLGSMGTVPGARAMYGLAAKPLSTNN